MHELMFQAGVKGMSSLRSQAFTPANSLKHQLMHELNNCSPQSPDPPWIQRCKSHIAALRGRLDHQVHLHMRMRSTVHLGVPDRSCEIVNQLASETR